MLAAVAAPCSGFSQIAFEPVAADEQRQIVEKIQQAESQGGPKSTELVGPLTALGLLYQEAGDHHLAAATIDRALQVVRANYGLYSLEQAPLIRQSIHNEEARSDAEAAWSLEQELLTLAKRHPDDLRTVPVLRDIADRRMAVLRRYSAGEFPPEIVLGCYYNPLRDAPGSCRAGSKSVVLRSIAAEALRHYMAATRVMVQHGLYSSDELRDLEMELVRISYQLGNAWTGRQSLHRLAAYDAVNSAPLLTRMGAIVQIADWDLLAASGRDAKDLALDTYERAYQQLTQGGTAQASIDQIFAPQTPVMLPTFLPNPLISEEPAASGAYIDVAFGVSKYGESQEIEILAATKDVTHAAQGELVRLIARSRFRPRFTAGRVADGSPVVVRYYVHN
jgi:tetratricopeptide (TPR) repeat protein